MVRRLHFKSQAAYHRYLQGLHARRNAGKIPPHPKGKPYPKVVVRGRSRKVMHGRR